MKKYWYDGILGAVVGDAVGVPYEFKQRDSFICKDMDEYGTHRMPKGTWSDDSSMILATIDSLVEKKGIFPEDIMKRFKNWLEQADYCAADEVFDYGRTVYRAVHSGQSQIDETDNGNGSLMRIIPICLYCIENNIRPIESAKLVHKVSALTHGHERSKIACGLYYSCIYGLLKADGNKEEKIQSGINIGFHIYKNRENIQYYDRLKNIDAFKNISRNDIKSTGYVVDTLEAALWVFLNCNDYKDCILKAVNLGEDTDTIACIAGGLAGIYYGGDSVPVEWISNLKKKEWILSILGQL